MKKRRIFEGLQRGEAFFSSMERLGVLLLFMCGVVSMMFFWIIVVIYFQDFISIAGLMIKVLKLALYTFIFCFLFKLLCRYGRQLLYNRELKLIGEEIKSGKKSVNRSKECKKKLVNCKK